LLKFALVFSAIPTASNSKLVNAQQLDSFTIFQKLNFPNDATAATFSDYDTAICHSIFEL
jgi:hypothetical protein